LGNKRKTARHSKTLRTRAAFNHANLHAGFNGKTYRSLRPHASESVKLMKNEKWKIMKTLQVAFLLLICFSFCNFAFTQEKSIAVKFDEFSSLPYVKSDQLTDRANRLARQILKEPKTSKAVIIFYNQRKGTYPSDKGKDWADYALGVSVNGYNIPRQQIILINGGYREYATLEFWIVPQNAQPPEPTPSVDKTEIVICPEIRVASDGFRHDRTQPLKFSVAIKGAEPNAKLNLEWNASAGKIIEGQGTNQIKIDLSQTDAKKITASVQVKGLAPECSNHSYATTEVGNFPYKFADFQYNYSYMAAVLDGLMSALSYEPEFRGYIIIYGRRVGNSREVARTIHEIQKYFNYRRFDPNRVTVVDGGFREEGAVEIYLIPSGVEDPKPTPTVDEKFVVFNDKIKRKITKRKR
jgi:hypothetical protein